MDVNFNKAELDFPDILDDIDDSLKELRKNTDSDALIEDNLMQSALNIYIENAMVLAKKNNMITIGDWDDLEDSFDEHHRQRRDRELLENNLSKINQLNKNAKSENILEQSQQENFLGDQGMKMARDKGLLQLAEKGKLFDIDMNNVYKSVGDLQVKNFERYYGVKN